METNDFQCEFHFIYHIMMRNKYIMMYDIYNDIYDEI